MMYGRCDNHNEQPPDDDVTVHRRSDTTGLLSYTEFEVQEPYIAVFNTGKRLQMAIDQFLWRWGNSPGTSFNDPDNSSTDRYTLNTTRNVPRVLTSS
jgi:hypothetical protein